MHVVGWVLVSVLGFLVLVVGVLALGAWLHDRAERDAAASCYEWERKVRERDREEKRMRRRVRGAERRKKMRKKRGRW